MNRTRYNEHTRIWSGNHKVPTFNPKLSAGQVLLTSMLNYSSRIAQISDNNGIEITFDEMYLKSLRVAKNLLKMGYRQGDVIGYVSGNHHDLTPFIIACLTLGMPVSVLSPILSEGEIERLFRITKPKLIICEKYKINVVEDIIKNLNQSCKLYAFDSQPLKDTFLDETESDATFIFPDIGNGVEYPAIYICTSGTTGLPKCYAYSHASLIHNLQYSIQTITCDDVITTFGSMYWLTGWIFMLSGLLHGCKRIITTELFSAQLFSKIVEKYKVTRTFMPPSNVAALLNYQETTAIDLSSLQTCILGGSAVALSLIEKLMKIIPDAHIQIIYGSTESGGFVTRVTSKCNLNSVGLLECGSKIKILDDQGSTLGINEIGEICTWKDFNRLGYINNNNETDQGFNIDGWISTGDCGYFNESGYLYVVDRKKDILKYRNYHISPSEIENIIQSHCNINNVCVVGVPDFECTDLPAAFIIRSQINSDVTEEDIEKIVTEKLSDPKQLRGGVYFIEQFPLNVSGKILRRELKKLAIELYAKRQKLNN